MEACCLIVVAFFAICIGLEYIENSIKEGKKREAERQRQEYERQEKIKSFKNCYQNYKQNFENKLGQFFNLGYSAANTYKELSSWLESMKKVNKDLQSLTGKALYSTDINHYVNVLNKFKTLKNKIEIQSLNKMMNESNYGTINTYYWNNIQSLTKAQADSIISQCEQYKSTGYYMNLMGTDIDMILRCIWFYAISKPFSAQSFNRAVAVFHYFVKTDHVDIVIAELYAKNQMGGDKVIQNSIRDKITHFKYTNRNVQLTGIASSLMWLKAYDSEKTVLQYMLDNGVQMPVKAQERLHSLANGGGKAPNIYNAKTSSSFDVSSISWNDTDFNNFFDNLSFQEKKLSYSLAMRDEDKNLLISSSINLPDNIEIANILNAKFNYEYGNVVKATSKNFVALSGSGKENIPGILIQSKECKHMAILVHIARIGKKLNIKFYTLFMPVGANANDQKQLAISLFKKLSPTVSTWESSMKDSVLLIIQQILNSGTQTRTPTSTTTNNNNDEETYL